MGDASPKSHNSTSNGSAMDLLALHVKYIEEKEKRFSQAGASQYEELQFSTSGRFRRLDQDPWVDHEALNAETPVLEDGNQIKVLIQGAGYGGLLFAIRFVQQGIKPSEICLVDAAGGFSGTWWWNRFPGLTCDTQSSVYIPLLEKTGYMPKHRYSGGQELLAYADVLAEKWDLKDRGIFRSAIRGYDWEDEAKRWVVKIKQGRRPREESITITVKAQFVVVANGVLNHPKVPKSVAAFEGPTTHTARWDYGITGGTPDDPKLVNLTDKRVGIVGTGATAVQAIPEVATWAKELYVFQRTPSSVAQKGQHKTDPEEWEVITSKPGWHRRRIDNIDASMAIIGGPHEKPITVEDIPRHIDALHTVDTSRTKRVRRRVNKIVTDKATAEALKAWYPTWCKRPAFHDKNLQTFNLPHVHLVDVDGKGVECATKSSLIANGQEYPLDVLILSTGFRSPAADLAEPSKSSNMTIRGRNRLLMADKWEAQGPSTLHGVASHDFPNLFLTGPLQTGVSSNFARVQDVIAEHCAYIVQEAIRRAGEKADSVLIEARKEGEEAWAGTILERASWLGGMSVCLPGYQNNEGELGNDPASQMKLARGSQFAQGMNAHARVLEAWRAEGSMKYIDVSS